MIKRLNKKYIILSLMIIGILIIPTNGVKAALQANANTHYKMTDRYYNWSPNIRQMESIGGTMGLNETINSDLTPTSNNGIDVHMVKNSEFGATAILSASGYGNAQTIQNSEVKTTTGNKTGIYFSGINYEVMASGIFSYSVERYWEKYGNYRVGDALNDCKGWHSSKYSQWPTSDGWALFIRGGTGLFSYTKGMTYDTGTPYYTRGIAVCGPNF